MVEADYMTGERFKIPVKTTRGYSRRIEVRRATTPPSGEVHRELKRYQKLTEDLKQAVREYRSQDWSGRFLKGLKSFFYRPK